MTGSSEVNDTSSTRDPFSGVMVSAARTAVSVALRAGSSRGPDSEAAGSGAGANSIRWIAASVRSGHDGGCSDVLNSGFVSRFSRLATCSMTGMPRSTSAWVAMTASVIGSTRRMLCISRTVDSLAS